jgi:hypothetical protein
MSDNISFDFFESTKHSISVKQPTGNNNSAAKVEQPSAKVEQPSAKVEQPSAKVEQSTGNNNSAAKVEQVPVIDLPSKTQPYVPPPNAARPLIKQETGPAADLIGRIKEYASKNNVCLAILTPCYGGQCQVSYVTSLLNTMVLFSQIGVKLRIEFCRNDSLVSRARNNLIAKVMADPQVTHMLFIDGDITWSPHDILKLILSEKGLVGGVYPIKNYEWAKLVVPGKNVVKEWIDAKNSSQLKGNVSDVDIIQQKLVRYNLNYLSNTLEIHNNITKLKHLATGFMMIRRETIEKMSRAFPSTKYTDDVGFLVGDENRWAYALFDCGVEDDHYCSEDWLFCSRWTKMGGEVFADVTINLNHCGIEEFKGSYISSLV